jgi:hypothetical protein
MHGVTIRLRLEPALIMAAWKCIGQKSGMPFKKWIGASKNPRAVHKAMKRRKK